MYMVVIVQSEVVDSIVYGAANFDLLMKNITMHRIKN